jgi:hypothetical protein
VKESVAAAGVEREVGAAVADELMSLIKSPQGSPGLVVIKPAGRFE